MEYISEKTAAILEAEGAQNRGGFIRKNYGVVNVPRRGEWPNYESVLYECNDIRKAQEVAEKYRAIYDEAKVRDYVLVVDRDLGPVVKY